MTKEELLDSVGDFSWDFGRKFFVETSYGNFVWDDPDYGGDNSFTRFDGNYGDFCDKYGVPFCRDKGRHFIRAYCGTDIRLI